MFRKPGNAESPAPVHAVGFIGSRDRFKRTARSIGSVDDRRFRFFI
jgi:hypothetical protein